MNTKSKTSARTRGSALFTALIIMGVLGLVSMGMIYMAVQQPYNVRRSRDQIHAQAIAEAGANIAYVMLATNFALKDNPAAFPQTSYHGGTYAVTVNSMSPTSAVLTSVGTYYTAQATVAMDVQNCVSNVPAGTAPPPVGLYTFAIAAGTEINGGTSSAGAGINGNVEAPVILDPKGKITGTQTIGTVNVSNLIDLTPYLNAAIANGTMFVGNQDFHNYVAPGNGIVWVQGNMTLKGNVTGCFIATGDITANGGYTQTRVGNYPAVVSQNGNINIYNSSSEGLIYAPQGNVYLGGNASIRGTVIAAGTVSFSGCAQLYENSTPVAPLPAGPAQISSVGISGWRQ